MRRHLIPMVTTAFVSAAAPVTASATSPPVIRTADGQLIALSCPTARLCYAGGNNRTGAIVDTLRDGAQVRVTTIPGDMLYGISCPARDFCELAATGPRGQGIALSISHDAVGRPLALGWLPWFVSCPSVHACVIAGMRSFASRTIETAVVAGGRIVSHHRHRFRRPITQADVSALSCASIAACELTGGYSHTVGNIDYSGPSFFVGLGRGAAFGPVHLDSNGPPVGYGLACPRRTRVCYLTADSQAGGLLLSLRIGGVDLRPAAAMSGGPVLLSCDTPSLCTAAGYAATDVPTLQSFDHARAGSVEAFPSLNNFSDDLPRPGVGFTDVARVSPGKYVALAATPSFMNSLGGPTYVISGQAS